MKQLVSEFKIIMNCFRQRQKYNEPNINLVREKVQRLSRNSIFLFYYEIRIDFVLAVHTLFLMFHNQLSSSIYGRRRV